MNYDQECRGLTRTASRRKTYLSFRWGQERSHLRQNKEGLQGYKGSRKNTCAARQTNTVYGRNTIKRKRYTFKRLKENATQLFPKRWAGEAISEIIPRLFNQVKKVKERRSDLSQRIAELLPPKGTIQGRKAQDLETGKEGGEE